KGDQKCRQEYPRGTPNHSPLCLPEIRIEKHFRHLTAFRMIHSYPLPIIYKLKIPDGALRLRAAKAALERAGVEFTNGKRPGGSKKERPQWCRPEAASVRRRVSVVSAFTP